MNRTNRLLTRSTLLTLLAGLALAPPAGAEPPQTAPVAAWLEERSMLRQAREAAVAVSGRPEQWRHPYGTPQPREAVRHASVWLLDYPGSVITRPGRSVIATWADPALWDALRDLGVDLLHTGPVQRTAWISRLFSTSPGTMTGPPSPPLAMPGCESSRSCPLSLRAWVE